MNDKSRINIHKIGDAAHPATEQDIKDMKEIIVGADIPQTPSDTEMLNWLQEQTKGYGCGWIVRDSSTGRGMRLHETSQVDAKPSIREAIVDAMRNSI